jgi:hypothetical protein
MAVMVTIINAVCAMKDTHAAAAHLRSRLIHLPLFHYRATRPDEGSVALAQYVPVGICYTYRTFSRKATLINLKGHRIQKDIVLLCVRWYLAYPLSYRNLEEMLEEHGVAVRHHGLPEKIILDQSGANTAAIEALVEETGQKIEIRQNKYLNKYLSECSTA